MLIARLPAEGVAAFEEYERRVLPLLSAHGGRLVRRLRSTDRLAEVHLVEFPSPEGFTAYRDDRRRSAHAELLRASGAELELLELYDAAPG